MKTQKDKERRKDLARGVMFLVVSSMLIAGVLAVYSPVHASGPTVVTSVSGFTTNTNTLSANLVMTPGDSIFVSAEAGSSDTRAAQTVTSVTEPTVPGITFTQMGQTISCIAASKPYCVNYMSVTIWAGIYSGTFGTNTITVTWTSVTNSTGLDLQAFDVNGVSVGLVASSTGACSSSVCMSPNIFTSPSVSYSGTTIQIAALIGDQAMCAGATTVSPGPGYALYCPGSSSGGLTEVGVVSSPTNFPMTQASGTARWTELGIVFGSGTQSNIQCTPQCTPQNGGGYKSNSTSMFTGGPSGYTMFYFIQQAPTAIISIQNITVKIASVQMSTNTGKIGYALYEPAAPNAPASAGNQWTLQKASFWPITNQSSPTAFFLHANPGWQVCASCYYMVAILANSTHSNSHTVTASGVKFFETSLPVSEYYYGPGTPTFPTTFYTANLLTPRLFLYVEGLFTVVTSTVTSTLTGTMFSTSTVTITSTSLDANLSIQTTTGYTLALLIILVPALALGGVIAFTTKSFPGFAVGFITGAAIGTGLGVQYSLVTVQFEALAAIAMVFMAVMAFVTSRGSGGV